MLRSIVTFGVIAGIISALPSLWIILTPNLDHHSSMVVGMAVGYLAMLVAFSFIFVAIKRYRDNELGGVIKFLPAFGIGLAITFVAGIFYVGVWDIYQHVTHFAFADEWAPVVAKDALKHGASPAEAARKAAEFKSHYLNPAWRWSTTFFEELFPVGFLVSLVSAGLLRFRQFLPARGVAT